MEKLSIHIDSDSISLLKNGNHTGAIWVSCGSESFPEGNWYDFPVIILEWWGAEIVRLDSQVRGTAELCFMDGPYFIMLEKSGSDCIAKFMSRNESKTILYETKIDFHKMKKEIASAQNQLIRLCRQNSWNSDDIDNLQHSLETLRKSYS